MDEELLKRLRAMGVKTATFLDGDLASVEFFPVAAPSFGHLDLDTIVPPPPAEEQAPEAPRIPKSLANILKKGSVS